MNASILKVLTLGMLSIMLTGCISGRPHEDTYTDKTGKTSVIESDAEQCTRSCNEAYSRCMESTDARDNGGVNGPKGMFGASSDCRADLSSCLPGCKAGK